MSKRDELIQGKVCQGCGVAATILVQDIKEVFPENGYRKWERFGEREFYCAQHSRKPVNLRLQEAE